MALETLEEVVISLKRKTGYGTASATTDAITAEIIKFINDRNAQVSRFWAWDWLYKAITITLTGADEYTLDADIAAVVVLSVKNQPPLKRITLKEKAKWFSTDNPVGRPYYLYTGRNTATGARIITVGNIDTKTTTITGTGKTRMTKFVLADIGLNKNFLPMPDDMVGILKRFIESDIENAQGKKDEWPLTEKLAQDALNRSTGEEQSDAGEEPKSPLPDTYRRKKAWRRAGRTA